MSAFECPFSPDIVSPGIPDQFLTDPFPLQGEQFLTSHALSSLVDSSARISSGIFPCKYCRTRRLSCPAWVNCSAGRLSTSAISRLSLVGSLGTTPVARDSFTSYSPICARHFCHTYTGTPLHDPHRASAVRRSHPRSTCWLLRYFLL